VRHQEEAAADRDSILDQSDHEIRHLYGGDGACAGLIAAQLTTAGAVNERRPAMIPMANAIAKTEAVSMELKLSVLELDAGTSEAFWQHRMSS
jgi:hypothetical protein